MAKIVYVCTRDVSKNPLIKQRVGSVVRKLVPDNIPDAPCKFYDNGHIIYGISTYSGNILESHDSVCMGLAYPAAENWWKPLGEYPDGSFAIFRSDENYVEALTDEAGSRSIWYYKDEEIFVTGTSQRAIISVIGKFHFDKRTIPWMLSSGTLGPSLSWCKNLHVVKPGGSVILNRKNWSVTTKLTAPPFTVASLSDEKHREGMKQAIYDSFRDINIDFSKWTLPISGGSDSRGIVCLLKETGKDISNMPSITWGLKASLSEKNNDAYVASAVAKAVGLKHRYFETDHCEASVEKIFDRFIKCGEGRVDHVPGYMDGFATWKAIHESGSYGIIRGDESFGWDNAITEHNSRLINNLTLCDDYNNLEYFEESGYEKQLLPDYLQRREGETVNTWADRLYEEFTIPALMAALNDLKLSYTEVINPLLSRKIMLQTRTLPDHLREDKKIFREIVNSFLPDIKYATKQATIQEQGLFTFPETIAIITNELSMPYMKELFPAEFLQKVITGMRNPITQKRNMASMQTKLFIKKLIPAFVKEKIRNNIPKPTLNTGVLAFRIYMIGKTYRMLAEDIKTAETVKSLTPA
ncbi:MAG: hypothetical protein QM791_11330 [Ferruginibacter sp.]